MKRVKTMPHHPSFLSKLEPFWGKWTLVERIGIGSYGQVFCVQNSESGKKAALKWVSIPKDELAEDSTLPPNTTEEQKRQHYKNIAQMLMKEVRLMEKLSSNAHVVRIYEASVIERTEGHGCDLLILMELLTPLRKAFPNGTMSEAESIKLCHDICDALIACESLRILHRDIKPENIFVDEYGKFKLGDFGVAKQMERTMGGSTGIGTPLFMAPEMLITTEKEYGITVDLYALGLVMHRYLNRGIIPFLPIEERLFSLDENDKAFKKRIGGEKIPPAVNASQHLSAVIEKACAYKPRDRFQTAAEMQNAIVDKTISISMVKKQKQRKRVRSIAAIAGTLGISAFLVFAFALLFEGGKPPPPTPSVEVSAPIFTLVPNNTPTLTTTPIMTPTPIPSPTATPTQAPTSTPTPAPTATPAPIRSGDVILFGQYEQDNDKSNGKESVEWLVLDVNYSEGRALLLSKYVLDMQRYNSKWTKVSWEKCSVHTWLNGTFLKSCFSSDERRAILSTNVVSNYVDEYVETYDYVFFLSVDEAAQYLPSSSNRQAKPTTYAAAREVVVSSGNSYWWLRDSTSRKNDANRVNPQGSFDEYGANTNAYGVGVRPAVWIDFTLLPSE